MKKQGFTLIELMVVIVIMGILAAVAVPKLFGMIAKSKASEVGPAAGTYVKLQQAFFSERNAIGDWKIVGYSAPGTNSQTTNFTYSDETSYEDNTVTTAPTTDIWRATARVTLNDCKGTNAYWGVKGAISNSAEITFATGLGDETNCLTLTPNFKTIGTGTYTAN